MSSCVFKLFTISSSLTNSNKLSGSITSFASTLDGFVHSTVSIVLCSFQKLVDFLIFCFLFISFVLNRICNHFLCSLSDQMTCFEYFLSLKCTANTDITSIRSECFQRNNKYTLNFIIQSKYIVCYIVRCDVMNV